MNVVIISPTTQRAEVHSSQHVHVGGVGFEYDVWLRSALSGLMSLPMHCVILMPGCSEEQKQWARAKARPVNGKVVDLASNP